VALRKVPGPRHQRLVSRPLLARAAGRVRCGHRPGGVRPVVLIRGGLILFRFLKAHYLLQLLESVLGRQAHGYHGYLGQGKAQTEQVRFSRQLVLHDGPRRGGQTGDLVEGSQLPVNVIPKKPNEVSKSRTRLNSFRVAGGKKKYIYV